MPSFVLLEMGGKITLIFPGMGGEFDLFPLGIGGACPLTAGPGQG